MVVGLEVVSDKNEKKMAVDGNPLWKSPYKNLVGST